MEGRTNNHSSIRFWIIIACVVAVSASISFLITSPRHKKRDSSTVKQYSSTSDNSSDTTSSDTNTEKSQATPTTIEESKNEDSPFEGKYWVIFTEGTRNDRVEATSVDAISLKLRVIWDGALYLSKTNGGSKYIQYYLDENGEWCEMGKYFRFSDSASNVIASNLDVYDGNGNLLLKGCAYSDIDWDLINQYR